MREPIKLYLDEDTISRRLIKALSSRGVDVVTARDAGLIGASDREHLEFAAAAGRTIFTFNTRDFARLHVVYASADQHHGGVIVSDQIHVGVILRRLLKLFDARSSQDMESTLEYLSNWQ